MSTSTSGKRFKPLPLRRGFWRELPQKMKAGIVILAEDPDEREDIRNAAQSILISDIESRLMKRFVRPTLETGKEFYGEFFVSYMAAIYHEEHRIWEEICSEMDRSLSNFSNRDLSDQEAAYLSYVMQDMLEPPGATSST